LTGKKVFMECVINEVESRKSFKNDFGEVNVKGVMVFIGDKRQTIKSQNIVNIRWIKKQKYDWNCFAFLVALLFLFVVKENSFIQTIQSLFLLLSFLFFIGSFFLKSFKYTFLVITKNHDFIAIDVSKKLSQEAENLASYFNRSVSKTAKILASSY
jgi:hypothetical protein